MRRPVIGRGPSPLVEEMRPGGGRAIRRRALGAAVGAGLAALTAMQPVDVRAQHSDRAASDPGESGPVEDLPVGLSDVLERQRRAYEAFQDRRREEYESFQEQRRAEFEAYMERMRAQYETYKRIVQEEEQSQRRRIAERWDEPELSSAKVWVEYDADLEERRRVDFENQVLSIETLAGKSPDARSDDADSPAGDLLSQKIRALLTEDRATAFERDAVAQAIETRSRREVEMLETAEVSPKPILWSYLTGEDRIDEASLELAVGWLRARAEVRETRTASGERLQQVTIPLEPDVLLAQIERLRGAEMSEAVPEPDLRPSMGRAEPAPPVEPRRPSRPRPAPAPETRSEPERRPERALRPEPLEPPSEPRSRPVRWLPARARAFERPVDLYGARARLESALVFAIIETESAFNPVARSPVPAYGLMQIVPRSAGQDATEKLFGKPRILAPSYLYDAEKNIEIGTIFLDILLSRYLAGIRDPQSRLYCAIAAYNTGHGNVFKAFTGRMRPKAAFARINRMSPTEVYEHLVRNLPYAETRRYLPKVVSRLSRYRGWMNGG